MLETESENGVSSECRIAADFPLINIDLVLYDQHFYNVDVKKIVLSRLRNIKTLSRRDFELYSTRVPVILDSITAHFEESMSDIHEFARYRERLFRYVGNFMETGDTLSALQLVLRLDDMFGERLDADSKVMLSSAAGYLFVVNGMNGEGEERLKRALEISGTQLSSCYVFNLLTQSILAIRSGKADVAVSTTRRALDYMSAHQLDDVYMPLLPLSLDGLRYKLTKVHVNGVIRLSRNETAGSRKRKTLYETALTYVNKLSDSTQRRYKFYHLCERALLYAETGHIPKARRDLEQAGTMVNSSKEFFTAHSFYFYAVRAYLHSCRNDFSDAYMDAKLAFRASFNTPDVFMELYVMDMFLEVAHKFSVSYPEHRKDVSEFYMKGNSLLKQFVEFLEEKDWYTGKQHSSKVAAVSSAVGKKLVTLYPYIKTQLDLQTLYLSAYVHDIGKLKLPWTLINKIGRLEPYERSYLCRHVTFGQEILEELNFRDIARVVGQHHENLDGSGYPEGTRNVSIAANIINLADSFEAMTSPNRRYKQEKSMVESRDELIALKGRVYYPEVIEAFRQVDLNRIESASTR